MTEIIKFLILLAIFGFSFPARAYVACQNGASTPSGKYTRCGSGDSPWRACEAATGASPIYMGGSIFGVGSECFLANNDSSSPNFGGPIADLGYSIQTDLPCPEGGITDANGMCSCPSGSQPDGTYGSCIPATPEPPSSGSSAGMCTPNPIYPATGEKYRVEQDWIDGGQAPLSFVRIYRSSWAGNTNQPSVGMGQVWNHSYGTTLKATPAQAPTAVAITVPEGYVYTFVQLPGSSAWSPTNGSDKLTQTNGGGWSWRRSDDDTTYNFASNGTLQTQVARNGWTTTLNYNGSGQLASVTNPFGRSLLFGYSGDHLASITTPDGRVIKYSYDGAGRLASVTYPDGTNRSFAYENAGFPQALTGINDESGTRWGTFAYDSQGRAVSSVLAGGASSYQVAYPNPNTSTVTDPLGTSRSYVYKTAAGKVAVKSSSLPMGAGDAGARMQDANGLLTRETDFNGSIRTTAWDVTRRLPTSVTDAYGTPLARATTIQWHQTFSLPTLVTQPGRSIAYTYDAQGNVLSEVITDTKSSPANSRTWQWTYNAQGLVATATQPGGAVTTNSYDPVGNLTQSTNALGHVTRYAYDKANRLINRTEPNRVVTSYTWDARDHLLTQTVGGQQTMTLAYNPTGTLASVTLPAGEKTTYTYDPAHRLTAIQDKFGARIEYTLDNDGNRIAESVKDPSGSLARTLSRAIDNLGRIQKVTGVE